MTERTSHSLIISQEVPPSSSPTFLVVSLIFHDAKSPGSAQEQELPSVTSGDCTFGHMSGVHIDFGAQRTPEGPRPWWRVTTTPSVIKVDLTEDLDAVETAIENHRNAMDHLWTKMRKPESERDKNEPHQPRFGHPSQYAWLMAREYQEEHGAIIQLASEKHTGSEFHKPEVLLADAKPTIDDQGFGYTLSWNHGIRNDTVPISKAAADTLNEQRTQAKLLHHYFVGEYRKLTQASRESLFPRGAFSEASRKQIMSSLDALLNKARMDMSTVLQAGPAPDASVPGLSPRTEIPKQ